MEERTKNFINTIIFVSRIFSGLKDKFLARKLYDKLSDLISAYVAQSTGGDIKVVTDSLLELLDYLEHSKMVAVTPLLYARRSLFAFKLQLIRIKPESNPLTNGVEKESKAVSPDVSKVNISSEFRSRRKEINLSGNKQKILNYIKRSPDSRTKDIIYEFSVLSDRTVKRNLKELVNEGLIKKVAKDKAVFYNVL